MDSDQAIFGLQGMHFLKGEFPLFSWGYAYIGTLQSSMDALFFYFFGASRYVLNTVPLIFYAGYLIATYYIAKALFKESIFRILTVSFASIAPSFFVLHNIWGRHGYPETYCFGSIILALIVCNINKQNSLKFYFILLFVSGVAWWSDFLVLYYFVPLFFFILYKNIQNFQVIKSIWIIIISIAGFIFGSLPFWIYNIRNNFVSLTMFHAVSPKIPVKLSLFFNNLSTNVFQGLIGLKKSGLEIDSIFLKGAFHILMGVIMLFFVIHVTGHGLKSFFYKRKIEPSSFLLIFLLSLISIFYKSQYSVQTGTTALRYLIPFYSIYPVIIPYFLRYAFKRFKYKKGFIIIVAIIILIFNAYTIYKGSPFFNKKYQILYKNQITHEQKLYDYAKKMDEQKFLMMEYWKAARYTFDAKEKIIFAYVNSRYPGYLYSIFGDNHINYLCSYPDQRFEQSICNLGFNFSKKKFLSYTVYSDFDRVNSKEQTSIDLSKVVIKSNRHEKELKKMIDNNGSTLYPLDVSQDITHHIDFHFKEPVELSGLAIFLSFIIKDLKTEEIIFTGCNFYSGYKTGNHPFISFSPSFFEINFSPYKTESLRIEFTKMSRGYASEIKELVLFQTPETFSKLPEDDLFLFIERNKNNIDNIYCSIAFTSRVEEIFKKNIINSLSSREDFVSFFECNLFIFEKEYLSYNLKVLKQNRINYSYFIYKEFAVIYTKLSSWESLHFINDKIFVKEENRILARKFYALAKKNEDGVKYLENIERSLYFLSTYYIASNAKLDYLQANNLKLYQLFLKKHNADFSCKTALNIRFRNGCVLKGINFDKNQDLKENLLDIDYCLFFPEKIKNNFAVFIHFLDKDGNILFQDDYIIKDCKKDECFLPGELNKYKSIVNIPDNLDYHGDIEILFGIWDPLRKKRFKPETNLQIKNRGVIIGKFRK